MVWQELIEGCIAAGTKLTPSMVMEHQMDVTSTAARGFARVVEECQGEITAAGGSDKAVKMLSGWLHAACIPLPITSPWTVQLAGGACCRFGACCAVPVPHTVARLGLPVPPALCAYIRVRLPV